MKELAGKWKKGKDGIMIMKWKRRKIDHPLTILDIFPAK